VFVLLAAAFQDIFLSVMTPKNRRAEASSNLDDFLSLDILIIKSTIIFEIASVLWLRVYLDDP
jgi:hypothetical protein